MAYDHRFGKSNISAFTGKKNYSFILKIDENGNKGVEPIFRVFFDILTKSSGIEWNRHLGVSFQIQLKQSIFEIKG